jgi:hypothetical protein
MNSDKSQQPASRYNEPLPLNSIPSQKDFSEQISLLAAKLGKEPMVLFLRSSLPRNLKKRIMQRVKQQASFTHSKSCFSTSYLPTIESKRFSLSDKC